MDREARGERRVAMMLERSSGQRPRHVPSSRERSCEREPVLQPLVWERTRPAPALIGPRQICRTTLYTAAMAVAHHAAAAPASIDVFFLSTPCNAPRSSSPPAPATSACIRTRGWPQAAAAQSEGAFARVSAGGDRAVSTRPRLRLAASARDGRCLWRQAADWAGKRDGQPWDTAGDGR